MIPDCYLTNIITCDSAFPTKKDFCIRDIFKHVILTHSDGEMQCSRWLMHGLLPIVLKSCATKEINAVMPSPRVLKIPFIDWCQSGMHIGTNY